MPIYIFHSKSGGLPINFHHDQAAIENAKGIPGVFKVEFAPNSRIIWEREAKPDIIIQPKSELGRFKIGDSVRKTKGSQWQGKIVGAYSTELTIDGYVVESDSHAGSCQIYPASALELL